jgi:hypothetical protein
MGVCCRRDWFGQPSERPGGQKADQTSTSDSELRVLALAAATPSPDDEPRVSSPTSTNGKWGGVEELGEVLDGERGGDEWIRRG